MALGPRLDLRPKQALVMTARMQQSVRLLAAANLELSGHLAEVAAGNPLVEVEAPSDQPPDHPAAPEGAAPDPPSARAEPMAVSFGESGGRGGEGLPDREVADAAISLAAHLHAQLGLVRAAPVRLAAARWLIDRIDEAGYLSVPLDGAAVQMGLSVKEAEAALALVQSLDPTGVGARSLAECLALQAREADRYDPPMATLIANLDGLAKGQFARLKRLCGVDDEDFTGMLRELRGYDPKPGLRFGGEPTPGVVPDVMVSEQPGGGWQVALNPATLPRVTVDRGHYRQLRRACGEQAGRSWLADRFAEANWLVRALEQRQQTILKVVGEIVLRQDGFLRHGIAHLRPLTLRAVAEAVGLHESTVSRATSNKFLICARGTYELKFFFTSGVPAGVPGGARAAGAGSAADEDGGDASAGAVKAAIRSLTEGESAATILSDDALAGQLRARGYHVARRTVAKYREAAGIPGSHQRRRLKRLAAAAAGGGLHPERS